MLLLLLLQRERQLQTILVLYATNNSSLRQ
jgi:hypothetical protein